MCIPHESRINTHQTSDAGIGAVGKQQLHDVGAAFIAGPHESRPPALERGMGREGAQTGVLLQAHRPDAAPRNTCLHAVSNSQCSREPTWPLQSLYSVSTTRRGSLAAPHTDDRGESLGMANQLPSCPAAESLTLDKDALLPVSFFSTLHSEPNEAPDHRTVREFTG